jgi:hypothetical protein
MRLVHLIMLAAIPVYIYTAEVLPKQTADLPANFATVFSILAGLEVAAAFFFRQRMLPSALETMRSNPEDATALGRWRAANVLSMVLALSVALYGFVLRFMGESRLVAWPFFLASIILMGLWRPRLEEETSGAHSPNPL